MKRNNSREFTLRNNGITLIALIITIIILLILAGVTINMVLGQNGLLNNSREATSKYKDSKEKEELSLILAGYYMENIESQNKDMESYLNENNATLKEENNDEYTIEYNGYEYTVKKDTLEISNANERTPQNVTVIENGVEKTMTVDDIAKEPKKYYGARVTNYTQGEAEYRIFYIDTENKYGDGYNTIYLIADYSDSRKATLGTYASGEYTAYSQQK